MVAAHPRFVSLRFLRGIIYYRALPRRLGSCVLLSRRFGPFLLIDFAPSLTQILRCLVVSLRSLDPSSSHLLFGVVFPLLYYGLKSLSSLLLYETRLLLPYVHYVHLKVCVASLSCVFYSFPDFTLLVATSSNDVHSLSSCLCSISFSHLMSHSLF